MQYGRLGKTGYEVSVIGFGAWAIGGSWGRIDDDEAMRALHAAVDAFAPWIDRSRANLGVDRLDLVQLHGPPTDVYYHPELFAALDDLVASGAIAHYGVGGSGAETRARIRALYEERAEPLVHQRW